MKTLRQFTVLFLLSLCVIACTKKSEAKKFIDKVTYELEQDIQKMETIEDLQFIENKSKVLYNEMIDTYGSFDAFKAKLTIEEYKDYEETIERIYGLLLDKKSALENE